MMIAVPRDHTHAGQKYTRGMLVDLPESDIAWLMQAERTTRAALLAEIAADPIAAPQAASISKMDAESDHEIEPEAESE